MLWAYPLGAVLPRHFEIQHFSYKLFEMADEIKKQRRTAKSGVTKAIGRLNDVVLENLSAYDIQTRIDLVKDALQLSIDTNEEYVEECEEENNEPDATSGTWETNETLRVNNAVKDGIEAMKALKISDAAETKAVADAEEKAAKDRMVNCKKDSYKRNVDVVKSSMEHLDGLTKENEPAKVLEDLGDIIIAQLKCVEIALEELASTCDDTTVQTQEVSELAMTVNNKRRGLIEHMARRGTTVPVVSNTLLPKRVEPTDATDGGLSNDMNSAAGCKMKMRIEATKLPVFSGSVYGWPTFISTWQKVGEPNIQEDMRAHVLRTHLEGDALKLVSSCDDDYGEMINRLKREFGDPRKVTEVILASLRIKPLRDENTKGFLEFVDLLGKANEKLQKLNLVHEISNSQVLGDIEKRLPPKVREEWAKLICGKTAEECSKPYGFLIEFLNEQKRQTKYLTSVIRASTPASSSSSYFQGLEMEGTLRSDHDAADRTIPRKINCYKCGEEGHIARMCDTRKTSVNEYFSCACCQTNEHPNIKCDKFKGLNARERKFALKKVGACFICFNAHLIFNCPKKDRSCSICGKGNHHDLLCMSSSTTTNSCCTVDDDSAHLVMSGNVTSGTDKDTLLHFMRARGEKRHFF